MRRTIYTAIVEFFIILIQRLKAYRRGEKRLSNAPATARGRIYLRDLDREADAKLRAGLTPVVTLTPGTLYRAAEDKYYKIQPDGTLVPLKD